MTRPCRHLAYDSSSFTYTLLLDSSEINRHLLSHYITFKNASIILGKRMVLKALGNYAYERGAFL